jgi:hypothetical protein
VVCRSVGYLLRKDKREIVLVQSLTATHWGEALAIPRKSVKAVAAIGGEQ